MVTCDGARRFGGATLSGGESKVGLFTPCEHKGRARDRCAHLWWGSFRGRRVSLGKWANREIHSKAEADTVLDQLRGAIRSGTFNEGGLQPTIKLTAVPFVSESGELSK
jgi:hypothetical protein